MVEAARLSEVADDELRKVIQSGGAPGNGSMWIAPTKSARDLLPDAQSMMSTVLGLGCESDAIGRLCALLELWDDPGSQCAHPLDIRLHHTLTWTAGPARTCVSTGRLRQPRWTNLPKQSRSLHMDKFETNDKGERVVKVAITDLALSGTAWHTLD